MFVFSYKTSKKKIIAFIAAAILIPMFLLLMFKMISPSNTANAPSGKYSLLANSDEERNSFFSQFGWNIKEKPVEISDVIIPDFFNDAYENYNEIQKKQGLDLSKHKGKNCKKFIYEVLNYPEKSRGVRATIIVLDGKVIAGDIGSVEMNGFTEGFSNPNILKQTNADVDKPIKKPTEKPTRSTERETLAPDPKMPQAPTD